jgi:hypothetical protein
MGATDLQKNCLKIISEKTSEIFASRDFLSLPEEAVISILQVDELTCEEIEVFKACLTWAQKNSKISVQETISPLLPFIRFPIIPMLDLSTTVCF